MSKTATPRKLAKLLEKKGFVFVRQRGSHAIYVREVDTMIIVLPMHPKDISKGTLSRILKLSGLTIQDL